MPLHGQRPKCGSPGAVTASPLGRAPIRARTPLHHKERDTAVTYLDDVPLDWSRPELPELRDLFVQAYRRETAAEQLSDEAGILVGTFPHRENMRLTWTELIQVMGDQKRLRSLVERAATDPGAAAYRPRFEEMLKADPALRPPAGPAASDVWWKGDDASPHVAGRLRLERLMERRTRLIGIELAAAV